MLVACARVVRFVLDDSVYIYVRRQDFLSVSQVLRTRNSLLRCFCVCWEKGQNVIVISTGKGSDILCGFTLSDSFTHNVTTLPGYRTEDDVEEAFQADPDLLQHSGESNVAALQSICPYCYTSPERFVAMSTYLYDRS